MNRRQNLSLRFGTKSRMLSSAPIMQRRAARRKIKTIDDFHGKNRFVLDHDLSDGRSPLPDCAAWIECSALLFPQFGFRTNARHESGPCGIADDLRHRRNRFRTVAD